MKKALWFLSALALAGFGMVACDGDDSEPCGGCPENTVCIDVQNAADACMDGTQVLNLVAGGCLDAETGKWVDGQAVIEDDGDYVCSADDINYGTTCTTNDQCSGATPYCDPDTHICTAAPADPEYHYVRIDDKSDKATGDDPGADIDAVALKKPGAEPVFASAWKGYKRSDGISAKGDKKYLAADPDAAVGAPDGFVSYPAVGDCKYFKDNSSNIGNKTCKDNKDDASCDWDYTFVSLGGKGGYLILEFVPKIEAGDVIDVLEIGGNCNLTNTIDGGTQTAATSEKMEVSVSVGYDVNGDWVAIGEKSGAGTNGIASFQVSGTNL